MAESVPSPEGVVRLPPQVTALGEALAPVASGARQAMARRVRPSGYEFVVPADLSRHVGVIQRALTHLEPRLEGLMTDVLHKEGAGALEVGRAAGRLEQVLSEFVDGFLDVKATHAGPDSKEARTQILGVYRHHIREICNWLEELVAVISDPEAAIRQRGGDSAVVAELTVALNMTTPPQMAKLHALANSLLPASAATSEPSPTFERREGAAPGLVETIGALVFGVGVSEAVFGRSHG